MLTSLLDGDDQLAVCHAGHGVNSYAITYALAHRGLVLLTQVGWGGVYMDNSARAAELAEVFEACRALIARRVPDGRTLVCVESRLRAQSLCGWHPEIVPVARGTALTTALDLLTREQGSGSILAHSTDKNGPGTPGFNPSREHRHF